jgi:EAL domain-containing protein (putative c-di-GMP-specific phosphodiesterase class I)
MYYQPQIDAISERIIGVEALLRWQHPHRGVLTPAEFIYLVEETGLIIPIGDKIIQEVCAQGKQWQFEGCPPLRMAFNIASTQFKKRDLAKKIMIAVNETGLDPKLLEVEITESTIMEQLEAIDTMLKELHDSGIQIAIDDFGTGYSSLGYLKRFHISTIKLGQIFIKDITINSDEALLASAIIVMAKTLNLNIVAEGVETREQLELLRSQGCPILQGYYFSKPLSADNMTELLLKQKQAYLNEGL